MMSNEGYTKIVNFMTPIAAVLVLGRDVRSFNFIKKIVIFLSKTTFCYNDSFAQMCLLIGTVSRVSYMVHGYFVFVKGKLEFILSKCSRIICLTYVIL